MQREGARFRARKYYLNYGRISEKKGGDFVVRIHKRSGSVVLTLAFAAQAHTFASRQQEEQKSK